MIQPRTVRANTLQAKIPRGAVALLAASVLLLAAGCARKATDTAAADGAAAMGAAGNASGTTVYSGGDILTMAGRDAAYAEALAVRDGKILAVGTRDEVAKAAGAEATQVDLAGKTLLPGFIDTHGHMVYFGKNLMDADLVGDGHDRRPGIAVVTFMPVTVLHQAVLRGREDRPALGQVVGAGVPLRAAELLGELAGHQPPPCDGGTG
jgi:hypothetical protein